jgi:hypothetical protein
VSCHDDVRGRAAAESTTSSIAADIPARKPARLIVRVKRWLIIGGKACGPKSVHVKETLE